MKIALALGELNELVVYVGGAVFVQQHQPSLSKKAKLHLIALPKESPE